MAGEWASLEADLLTLGRSICIKQLVIPSPDRDEAAYRVTRIIQRHNSRRWRAPDVVAYLIAAYPNQPALLVHLLKLGWLDPPGAVSILHTLNMPDFADVVAQSTIDVTEYGTRFYLTRLQTLLTHVNERYTHLRSRLPALDQFDVDDTARALSELCSTATPYRRWTPRTPDPVAVLQIVGHMTLARYLSPRDVARLGATCRTLFVETQCWRRRIPWARVLPILAAAARSRRDAHEVPVALLCRPLHGLSVDQRDLLCGVIVPWLCQWGALAPLRALWKGGLTLDDIRSWGNQALHIACANGHLSVVEFLVEQGLGRSDIRSDENLALHNACENGHLPVAKFLVAQGLSLHDIRSQGNRALNIACANGHLSVLAFLVEQGLKPADIRGQANYALQVACAYGHLHVVQFLVEQGLDLHDIRTYENRSLRLACQHDHLPVVQFLVAQGLDLHDIRSQDNYALRIASELGLLPVVEFLVERGLELADLRSEDNYALGWACANGHLPVVKFLVERGLGLDDIRDRDNFALDYACVNGHLPVVQFLVAQGLGLGDFRVVDAYALQYARENGHAAVVGYIEALKATL
jgi:ankyrin repeat protein